MKIIKFVFILTCLNCIPCIKAQPTMTITENTDRPSGFFSNNANISLTFTSSESTDDFTFTDVTLNGGTLTSFKGSGTTYTATFMPSTTAVPIYSYPYYIYEPLEGLQSIKVAAGEFSDSAGNYNVESDAFEWNYDVTSPTMTITENTDRPSDFSSQDASIRLTFTSSESTIDFTKENITVNGGTLSSFTGSGTTYTATLTPRTPGLQSIKVAGGAFSDSVRSQNNVKSNTFVWTSCPDVTDGTCSDCIDTNYSAVCTDFKCNPGWLDSDNDAMNGCETSNSISLDYCATSRPSNITNCKVRPDFTVEESSFDSLQGTPKLCYCTSVNTLERYIIGENDKCFNGEPQYRGALCDKGYGVGQQGMCKKCNAGTYSDVSAHAACKTCSTNTYSVHNAPSCDYNTFSCPAGTFSSGTAACEACGVGFYNDQLGQSACKACGVYTGYNDETGQVGCKNCQVGQYVDKKIGVSTNEWKTSGRVRCTTCPTTICEDITIKCEPTTCIYPYDDCTCSVLECCGYFRGAGDDGDYSPPHDLKAAVNAYIAGTPFHVSVPTNISTWNVSLVTSMNKLFQNKNTFNNDLSEWDVSQVTNMQQMFNGAIRFNSDLSDWDVSLVTDMNSMFESATSFAPTDLSKWDVSLVIDFSDMFNSASSFDFKNSIDAVWGDGMTGCPTSSGGAAEDINAWYSDDYSDACSGDESTPGIFQDGYRGCQSMTISGRTCQKWSKQSPHIHDFRNYDMSTQIFNFWGGWKGLGDHNYCRNPDDAPEGIWCYTTDPSRRWEYCDPSPEPSAYPGPNMYKDTCSCTPDCRCINLERSFRSYTTTDATKNTLRQTYYDECLKDTTDGIPYNRNYTTTDCTNGQQTELCRCFNPKSIKTIIVDRQSESCANGRLTYTSQTVLEFSDDYEISKTCLSSCQPRSGRRLRSGRSLSVISELTTSDMDDKCGTGDCRGCKKCKDLQEKRTDKQPFKEKISKFVFAKTGALFFFLNRDIGGCAPFQCSGTTIWVSEGNFAGPPYYDFYTANSCDTDSKITSLSKTTTYTFKRCNEATTHPFWIGPYTTDPTGITDTGQLTITTGTEDVTYNCTAHSKMTGTLTVVNKCELDACEGCKMCHDEAEVLDTTKVALGTEISISTISSDVQLNAVFKRRGPQERTSGDGSCMPACKIQFPIDGTEICKWKKCKGCLACTLYRENTGNAIFNVTDHSEEPEHSSAAFFRPRPRTIDSDNTRNANVPTKFYGGCHLWCMKAFNYDQGTQLKTKNGELTLAAARLKVCGWKSCSGCKACEKEAHRLGADSTELAYKFKNYNSTVEGGTVKGACLGPMLCRSGGVFYNKEQCSNCK